jgi:16S rRNA G527 N7-methylase RsmG
VSNTIVQAQRIEQIAEDPNFGRAADLITVRAVRLEAAVLEGFRRVLRPAGLVLLFGAKQQDLMTLAGFEVVSSAIDAAGHPLLLRRIE